MRTRLLRVVLGFSCLLPLATMTSPTKAQGKDALAEALYKSALDLMEQGKDAEACPKLKQSQEIDPAVGTLLYLGLCYERVGKTASAWAVYRAAGEASRKANQPERREIAMERASKLEPALSTLTILMPGERAPGLEINLDGSPIGATAIGVPMPVDPGHHFVEVTAPGYTPVSEDVEVNSNGDARTITLGALAAINNPASPAQPGLATEPPRSSTESSRDRGAPPMGTQRTLGLVVGGVGIVGLAAGTYFGLHSQSKEDEARSNCVNYPTNCNSAGLAANDDAKSAAGYATAGFIVGGAALLGGILLYATAPSEQPRDAASLRVDPMVGSSGGGLSLAGRW